MKPANAATLELLRRRGKAGVTPLDALTAVGTFRLGARIFELKADGYDIETKLETTGNGKRIARYVLHEAPKQLTLGDVA